MQENTRMRRALMRFITVIVGVVLLRVAREGAGVSPADAPPEAILNQ
jgi:hypothetical protein